MSYDPEARQTSSMALVIGIIVLVLVVGGAIAFMTSRPATVPESNPVILHDQAPAPPAEVVPVPVPSNPAPDVTIVPPASSSSSSTTTTTTTESEMPSDSAGSSDNTEE